MKGRAGATRLVAAFLAWTAVAGAPALAGAYRVKSVSGTVLYRTPNAARWVAVRADTSLADGDLIQVPPSASVVLEEPRRAARAQHAARAVLTLSIPIVARLSPDLLRSVRLGTFFLDRPGLPKLPKEPDKPFAQSLKEAWERMTAVVTGIGPATTAPVDDRVLERQGMGLALSAHRLKILSPAPNSLFQTDSWPIELRVVWLRPHGPRRPFAVYFWSTEGQRAAPIGETGQDYFTVRAPHEGSYFVQVMSSDGVWQSPAVLIHAFRPLSEVSRLIAKTGRPGEPPPEIALSYPPDRLVTPARGETAKVPFAWRLVPAAPDQETMLTIAKDEQVIKKISSFDPTATADLPPGEYRWRIEAPGLKLRSEERALHIVKAADTDSAAARLALLQRLCQGGGDAVLALPDGL